MYLLNHELEALTLGVWTCFLLSPSDLNVIDYLVINDLLHDYVY